ncbi:MAG: hypothetical protein KDB14_16770 [Planctomycetales bacterium]|nr:hypothetical protein [Planctomycetales bacterium]
MSGAPEPDGEDLLREATAMPERLELRISDGVWIVGRRRGGGVSLFGEPMVLQFNAQLEVRRAFWRGARMKAEGAELHWMRREQPRGPLRFIVAPLSLAELEAFFADARAALCALTAELSLLADADTPPATLIAPEPRQFLDELRAWSAAILANPLRIAARPNAQ